MADTVTITLPREEAQRLDSSMSDLLCWVAGYRAALRTFDDTDRDIMGVEGARRMRERLNDALTKNGGNSA